MRALLVAWCPPLAHSEGDCKHPPMRVQPESPTSPVNRRAQECRSSRMATRALPSCGAPCGLVVNCFMHRYRQQAAGQLSSLAARTPHRALTSASAMATATHVARRATLGQPAPSELDTRVEQAMP